MGCRVEDDERSVQQVIAHSTAELPGHDRLTRCMPAYGRTIRHRLAETAPVFRRITTLIT